MHRNIENGLDKKIRSSSLAETRVVECCARFTIYDRMHWPPSNSKSFGLCKSNPLKCAVMLRSLYALFSTTALSNIYVHIYCMHVSRDIMHTIPKTIKSIGRILGFHHSHATRATVRALFEMACLAILFAVPDAGTLGPTVWVRIQSSLMFQFKSK